jgi:protein-S-isoprenylcysteine O-methyltransferase Ste14
MNKQSSTSYISGQNFYDRMRDVHINKQIFPPSYMLVGVLSMLVLHYLFPIVALIPKPWILLGVFPMALGIWINLIADKQFKEAQTAIKSFGDPSILIIKGVYRFSRNPMYLGMAMVLFGVAFFLGSLTPLVIVPIFIWLVNEIFIKFEERKLEEEFGQAFFEYASRVRRWI